jgi:hypothetical protein
MRGTAAQFASASGAIHNIRLPLNPAQVRFFLAVFNCIN